MLMATTQLPRISSVNHVVWLNTVINIWQWGFTSAYDHHVNDNMTAVCTYHTHTVDRVFIQTIFLLNWHANGNNEAPQNV